MAETKLGKAYFEYDPDKDYSGAEGIALAETIFKRCSYDFDKLHKWITMQTIAHFQERVIQDEKKLSSIVKR